MQLHAIFLLTAALTVAATPVTTFKSKIPAPRVRVPNIKTISAKIDMDQCGACFNSVGSTISACEPVFEGDFFSSFSCVAQVVSDFNVLQNDCLPCLQSITSSI